MNRFEFVLNAAQENREKAEKEYAAKVAEGRAELQQMVQEADIALDRRRTKSKVGAYIPTWRGKDF